MAGVDPGVSVQLVSSTGLTEAVHAEWNSPLAEHRAEKCERVTGAVEDGDDGRATLRRADERCLEVTDAIGNGRAPHGAQLG